MRLFSLKWILIFLGLMACVDSIEFDVPPAEGLLVVEGLITDQPGPYSIKLSNAMSINADSLTPIPVTGASIILFDDEGNQENFYEINPGEYITGGAINGQIGHTYYLQLKTKNGNVFQSIPETMKPAGTLTNINYEFEARKLTMSFGEVDYNVFNIYVDGLAPDIEENFIRWKFTGTYRIVTYPENHYTWNPPYTPYKDPLPCSGYIIIPGPVGSGGLLEKVGECTCCECWAREYELLPQLSDTQLITGNEFKRIKVGEAPINSATFYDKYMVEVEQMSLSKTAFEFYKLIRSQKENASSIFQPPFGELHGNIFGVNNDDPVIGMFGASSIDEKIIFLDSTIVPYHIVKLREITEACYTDFAHATTQKPVNWK